MSRCVCASAELGVSPFPLPFFLFPLLEARVDVGFCRNGWAATIVDTLTTTAMMGLEEEFKLVSGNQGQGDNV